MAKKPGHIPKCQFREFLKYWKSEKFKVTCISESQVDKFFIFYSLLCSVVSFARVVVSLMFSYFKLLVDVLKVSSNNLFFRLYSGLKHTLIIQSLYLLLNP
ncbi:hypothetical protein RDI58_024844 [Solanum bulbocastanum]|uniref:Uncharacterized protein n=1 Tax=Solanum bulbocastanum TaxID=147425 RepID=A0AAN8T3Z7_SOLBU